MRHYAAEITDAAEKLEYLLNGAIEDRDEAEEKAEKLEQELYKLKVQLEDKTFLLKKLGEL